MTFCRQKGARQRFCIILIFLFSTLLAYIPSAAQEETTHIGYGIHYGPNTNVSTDWVMRLGVDWVKVYTLDSAYAFPGKRILYRFDMGYPDNWEQFRQNIAAKTRAIAAAPIEAVEIHNEPNLSIEWGGRQPNAWQYVQMLRVAYTTIKSIKPSLIVVSGGLAPTVTTPDRMAVSDLEYAREMFENGAGRYFDAFGYHPYGYNLPPEADPLGAQPLVFRRTELIRALMEEYGIYKQIWLTEFGWLRDPREDGFQCSTADPAFSGFAWMAVSGAQQADYLVRAFDYAHKNWAWAGPMFVWNMNWQQMDWLEPCNHMRWFGLLRRNGEPTAAYSALQRMRRYPSRYVPRLWLESDPLMADISLFCPERLQLGTFTVHNIGYPSSVELTILPVNNGALFIEVDPPRARLGQSVKVYVNALNLKHPGQYPIYVNIRATIGGRVVSQSVQGYVTAWHREGSC
jgi:hypothetical protein